MVTCSLIIGQKFVWSHMFLFAFKLLNKLLIYQFFLLWSKILVLSRPPPTNLFSIPQSFPTHCASQCKHAPSVGPTVCHLSTWSLAAYSLSYNVRSHHIQTLELAPLSFGLIFSITNGLSSFQNNYIALPLFCFSLFLVLELTSSLPMCASLYVLSFDNPLEPLSPIKHQLKCSLPVSEGFLRVGDFSALVWVSFRGGTMLCENKSVFHSGHRCAALRSSYCRCLLLL